MGTTEDVGAVVSDVGETVVLDEAGGRVSRVVDAREVVAGEDVVEELTASGLAPHPARTEASITDINTDLARVIRIPSFIQKLAARAKASHRGEGPFQ